MATLEDEVIGPKPVNGNRKSIASLLIGALGLSSSLVLVIGLWQGSTDDWVENYWAGLAFIGLFLGAIAVFLGSIGWIDIRRGATDRGKFASTVGIVLGVVGALLVLAVFAYVVWILIDIIQWAGTNDATGGWD